VALVELAGVRKHYGPVQALRGLDGAIDGRCIGLLGPNGAGKSTLLKLLLGLTPFEGEARVLGLSPRRDWFAIRDRVGFMPETESTLAGMNAVETCLYAGELSGLPRTAAMQRAHAALYHVGLEDKRYLKVETYSTGMKQRVKLAQAIVHDPELLFLDEPTSGLDPGGRLEMLELIQSLPQKRGLKVILSTHLLPDIEKICDHVVALHQGALRFIGSVDEMRGTDVRLRWEVRVKAGIDKFSAVLRERGCEVETIQGGLAVALAGDPEDSDQLFAAAEAAGVQIRHLAPLRASLEAAFLKAVS
jgi:ABC-2 type transport system ATP-binding protein